MPKGRVEPQIVGCLFCGDKFVKVKPATKHCSSKCRKALNYKLKIENGHNRNKYNRNSSLRWLYGISEDDYKNLFEAIEGKCEICHKPSHKLLHVDHDHNTGKVRGLLCHQCNIGLGCFQDNGEYLENARVYLKKEGGLNNG